MFHLIPIPPSFINPFPAKSSNRSHYEIFKNNIETLIHYHIAPDNQLAYQGSDFDHQPISHELHNKVLSLPISPILTKQDVNFVISKVNQFYLQ